MFGEETEEEEEEKKEEEKEKEKEEEEKPTRVFAPLSPRSQKCFSDQQNVSIESQKEMFHWEMQSK